MGLKWWTSGIIPLPLSTSPTWRLMCSTMDTFSRNPHLKSQDYFILSHYYVSIRSSNASLQNNTSQCHYRGWHHMERSRSATFLTLFLTMDSTANTCSPMADSSISACPSVPPASRRPLPPERERWRISSAVPQSRQPNYFPDSSGSHDPRTLPRAFPRVHCDFTKSATHLHAARPSSLCARSLK